MKYGGLKVSFCNKKVDVSIEPQSLVGSIILLKVDGLKYF